MAENNQIPKKEESKPNKRGLTYHVDKRVSDRGSKTITRLMDIEVDGTLIKVGETVPKWIWKGEGVDDPLVKYFDGELLEIEFLGKDYSLRIGEEPVELLSASCSDNIYVQESRAISVGLERVVIPDSLPSLGELYRRGSYNVVVVKSLSLLEKGCGEDTAKWFLRVFQSMDNIFYLVPETLQITEESAEAGNRYALFAWGRYHLCAQPEEDSTATAMKCFEKAWEKGLAEAGVSIAMAYDYGEMGLVDRLRSKKFLQEALDRECEYAALYQTRKIIYGRCGVVSDPDQAIRICDGFIERCAEDELDPMWYTYKGEAFQQRDGLRMGRDELRKAAEMGEISAWKNIVFSYLYNEDGEPADDGLYIKALGEGASRRNSFCECYWALSKVENYDDIPWYNQRIYVERLLKELEKAISHGSAEAAMELGDIYCNGYYSEKIDYAKAYSYYAKGALLNLDVCFEKMFDMISDGLIEKTVEVKDMLALYGARLGRLKLIYKTAEAYLSGRLTEFASEIEQYYLPVFKENEEEREEESVEDVDEEDEDIMDDDGRFDPYV